MLITAKWNCDKKTYPKDEPGWVYSKTTELFIKSCSSNKYVRFYVPDTFLPLKFSEIKLYLAKAKKSFKEREAIDAH